uniref:Uncharacterized protein n=1 Tax=Brassica oleracea var. oleracea TaxID=109376 RepID=A0A0D3CIQ9_BRAOL
MRRSESSPERGRRRRRLAAKRELPEFSKLTQLIHLDVPIIHTKRTPKFTFTQMDQLTEQTNRAKDKEAEKAKHLSEGSKSTWSTLKNP